MLSYQGNHMYIWLTYTCIHIYVYEVLLLFIHSVVFYSLRLHGLEHTRLPCPSPSPGVCSNSRPASRWCIQPSYPLSSPSPLAFNLTLYQGLFQWVSSSHQVAKVLEFQLQHQSFQWIFRIDFLWDWLVWSLYHSRDSQESSPTPQFKDISSSVLSLLFGPALTSIHDYWKNHSFDYTASEYVCIKFWLPVGLSRVTIMKGKWSE